MTCQTTSTIFNLKKTLSSKKNNWSLKIKMQSWKKSSFYPSVTILSYGPNLPRKANLISSRAQMIDVALCIFG